jgi:hypothetical protein
VTWGLAYCASDRDECRWFSGEDITAVVAFAHGLAGSLAGATVGWLVGSQIKVDRWEEVPLDRFRASLVAQRDGRLGLAVSITF